MRDGDLMYIIYNPPNPLEPAVIITPVPSTEMTVDQIAKKDVPVGTPYWVVPLSTMPTDRTYRDAWRVEADEPPHGYGTGDPIPLPEPEA